MAADPNEAIKFNRQVLQKLQKAFEKDPEVDLASKLPADYSNRLLSRKAAFPQQVTATGLSKTTSNAGHGPLKKSKHSHDDNEYDVRDILAQFDEVSTVCSPSQGVLEVLTATYAQHDYLHNGNNGGKFDKGGNPPEGLVISGQVLSHAAKNGQVLWVSPFGAGKVVIKCASDIVMKIAAGLEDLTEYHTLRFLESAKPSIPAPRAQGLFITGKITVMFMTYLPSQTLGKVWPNLQPSAKRIISAQLDDILRDLRTIRQPDDQPFGDIENNITQDVRVQVRRSKGPIKSNAEFEDFQFSNPHYGGSVYVAMLRDLLPPQTHGSVFTHGDIRPDNIMIDKNDKGDFVITGLIDWQYSGFYPDHFECTKITNTMSSIEEDDWYLHLPSCVAPGAFAVNWLVDRLWWNHVA